MPISTGRLLILALTVTLLAPAPAVAATIRKLDITHNNGNYLISFDVLLAAQPARTQKLLTDYTQWPRLSDTVRESHLLKTFPDGQQRVRLSFYGCVLIFCKTFQQVKDVAKRPNGDTVAVMVPEQSDFDAGWERVQILAKRNKTRVQYDAQLAPAFFVPPLIGPWILKRKLRRLLIGIANKSEALAAP